MAYVQSTCGGDDFDDLQYTNYTAANIKNGIAISVKDGDGNVLKTATGTYKPSFTSKTNTYKHDENYEIMAQDITGIKNITSMTFYIYTAGGNPHSDGVRIYKNGSLYTILYLTYQKPGASVTVSGLTDNSSISIVGPMHSYGYGSSKETWFIQISSFS